MVRVLSLGDGMGCVMMMVGERDLGEVGEFCVKMEMEMMRGEVMVSCRASSEMGS